MEVQIEVPGGLQREMRVTIPADRVAKALETRLRDISRRAKLPGFRPGKAPFKVIQQQFSSSARQDVVSDLIQTSYPQALTQLGVRPAGQPQIDIMAESPGQPLEYTARFEVFPDVQLLGLDSLQVEKPVVEVTEADVDRLVANLRKGHRKLNDVTRAAAIGDVVKADFEGRVDGLIFQGGKGENVEIELGSKQFLPDLENGIAGHTVGETFEVAVSFPADYRAESLRGRVAQFSVTLKDIKEAILPDVEDPEFLKAHSVETVDMLRHKAREALDNERHKAAYARQKNQVLEQLVQRNPIDVPQALTDQEIPRMREQAAQRMNMQNVPPEKLAEMFPAPIFEPAARRKVALGLLLGEYIKQKQVRLDLAKVEVQLDSMARDFEQPEEVKAYYRSKPELLDGLRAVVLEDQVVDQLLVDAVKTELPMTLEQLLNPQAKA
ncbi:MAG: trigger factor [Panacagrimonas sp.]